MDFDILGIKYNSEFVVTDVDDCLIKTSEQIAKTGLTKALFWFNETNYQKYSETVFKAAELTEWGVDFLRLVKNGTIKEYVLLTSAAGRKELLIEKFDLQDICLLEGYENYQKRDYLNSLKKPFIYVDDKQNVINEVRNDLMTGVVYPPKHKQKIRKRHGYTYKKRI